MIEVAAAEEWGAGAAVPVPVCVDSVGARQPAGRFKVVCCTRAS
jgi:hypothetical protein